MRSAEKARWLGVDVWVLTPKAPDYPTQLTRRLKKGAPAMLWGCGNRQLLKKGGLAVVGSRDATGPDLSYARYLGEKAAAEGHPIISGCARGIDETAMTGALERGGEAIGIVAGSLIEAAVSVGKRLYLQDKKMALISPFGPMAAWTVARAMGRNRYIYCLSDAAVVVASVGDKGGTWAGATQALRSGWVRVWVKEGNRKNSGHVALERYGARRLPDSLSQISNLFDQGAPTSPPVQMELDF